MLCHNVIQADKPSPEFNLHARKVNAMGNYQFTTYCNIRAFSMNSINVFVKFKYLSKGSLSQFEDIIWIKSFEMVIKFYVYNSL